MSKKNFGINLLIAGIPFRVVFLNVDEAVQKKINKRYENFITADTFKNKSTRQKKAEIKINLFKRSRKNNKRVQLPHCRKEIFFWKHEGKFQGKVDLQKKKAEFTCVGSMLYIDRVLRVACSLFIIDQGGVLLHASSMMKNNQGYVFFGHQGAGKSTIIKLLDGKVLSDDTAILFSSKNKVFIFTSPFDPKIRGVRNLKAELKSLFLLDKSKMNRISLIKKTPFLLLFGHLRPNLKFFENCGILQTRLFQNLFNLTKGVSVYRFQFKKTSGLWEVIDAHQS